MSKKVRVLVATMATIMTVSTVMPTLSYALTQRQNKGLKISVLSDAHLFPAEFAGEQGPNFQNYLSGDRKMLMESERILDAAIEKIIAEKPDVLIIPGDLTKDSEKISHNMLAEKLKEVEEQGIETFVINGNHDINNPDAVQFIPDLNNPGSDMKVSVETVKQDEFMDIYEEFGYEQAIAKHEGSVSYVAQLKPGYRLIAMDTGTYGDDPSEQATSGYFRDGLVEWVLEQIKEAEEAGDRVIGMMHHGIVEHFEGQATIFAPYVVEDWDRISTLFADAGMKYVFTGHFHAQDIVSKTTEAGNEIYDIMTGSLVTAPSPIRTVEFDKELERFKVESTVIDSIEGIEDFQSYASNFLAAGIPDMVVGLIKDMVLGLFPEEETYELNEVLKTLGFEDVNIDVVAEINKSIEENNEEVQALIVEEGINIESKDILGSIGIKDAQLKNFLIAVIDELKTATLPGTASLTSDGEDKKLMDIIQECLVEVYKGDEVYSDELKAIIDEMGKGEAVPALFAKAIVKHKMKLGLAGIILNEQLVLSLFNTEVSEGVTAGLAVSNALKGLAESLLTDEQPGDNNILLYAGKVLDSSLVVDAINTIPEVITLEHKGLVESIRFMYEDLVELAQSSVTNYSKLQNAEEVIAKLEEDKINEEAAKVVIDLINSLPENITLEDKELVSNIRNEFNNLSEVQKALVSNIGILEKAEETIKTLEEAQVPVKPEDNNNSNNNNNNNNNTNNNGNSNAGNGNSNNNQTTTNPSTGENTGVVGIALALATISAAAIAFRKKIFKTLNISK